MSFLSGACAAEAFAVNGNLENARYYMSTSKKEMAGFRMRTEALFAQTLPLMEIYHKNNGQKMYTDLRNESRKPESWHSLLSVMPLYTIPDTLLNRILLRNNITAEDCQRIRQHLEEQRELLAIQLSHGQRTDEFPILSRQEFESHPQSLSLSFLFYEQDIPYTYEEYLEHLEATRRFAKKHENYEIRENKHYLFRNIQITLRRGKWAIVSKNKSPVIHFVIRHPKLRDAIEQMAEATSLLGDEI